MLKSGFRTVGWHRRLARLSGGVRVEAVAAPTARWRRDCDRRPLLHRLRGGRPATASQPSRRDIAATNASARDVTGLSSDLGIPIRLLVRMNARRREQLLLFAVAVPAGGIIVWLLWHLLRSAEVPGLMTVLLLVGLVVSDALVFVPRRGAYGSTSAAFAFALLLVDGVAGAALGMALASALSDLRHRRPLDRAAFNVAQYVLSWTVAGGVLSVLARTPTEGADVMQGATIAAVLAAGTAYFVVNYFLVAAAVSLQQGQPLIPTWQMEFWRAAADDVGPLAVGVLIAAAGLSLATAPLFALPFVTFLGARQTVDRYEHALRDPLTGLVSRALFADRLQGAVQSAVRAGGGGFVLLIDLDGFKAVNDTHGHHAGDAVLTAVAHRIQDALRAVDTVGRLGGDEFAVLLAEKVDLNTAQLIVRKLTAAIERPIPVEAYACHVGASIGLAQFPAHGTDIDVLLHRADEDMYREKAHRRARRNVSR